MEDSDLRQWYLLLSVDDGQSSTLSHYVQQIQGGIQENLQAVVPEKPQGAGSGGGWGGTGSGSLRYLEDSVAARLHDHRRPLVVSFRRQKRAPMQDVIEVDADLAASRSSRGLSEICMARSSGSPNVIRRSDMKGFSYSPSAKLKNSFSFSSPLIMERLIIERSRSFAKDKQTPGNDLDGVLGSELRYRSETNNHPEVNQFGFDDRYRREVPKRSNCSFVEVHTLRPTHICPLSSKNKALEVQ
uniref:Uncharacterized protein LOC114324561 n=1 Tax=Diabrotica virgifera virgifera TaxID=50390 RepID=A0A6P7F037_DIAVI